MGEATIPLTKGLVARVDSDDYPRLAQFKWHAFKGRNGVWYAARKTPRPEHKVVFLHHEVMQTIPSECFVDHKDGDGLNNCRLNLRRASRSQNKANSISHSSHCKGVVRDRNKWRARIRVNGDDIHLGMFEFEEDAARAYDKAAREYFGEYALTNKEIEDSGRK